MAFDSTVRLKQLNNPEVSGYILLVVGNYLTGEVPLPTGNATGLFYPLFGNPSGFITTGQTGAFITVGAAQTLVNSSSTQVLAYVAGNYASLYFDNILSGKNTFANSVLITGSNKIYFPNGYFTDRQIYSNILGNVSLDWGQGRLQANSNGPSVDWVNQFLFSNTSEQVILDWDNGFAFDLTGNSSYDWNNRFLYDSGSNEVLDWNNRLLTGGEWNATNLNIQGSPVVTNNETGVLLGTFAQLNSSNILKGTNQFNSGITINSNSGIQFISSNGKLFDQSGVEIFNSFYFSSPNKVPVRTFYDEKAIQAIVFANGARFLYDSSGQVSIDFNNRILSGNWNLTGITSGFYVSGFPVITSNDTGQFYAANNPDGFITGFNSGLYTLNSNTGNFITKSQTGVFINVSQTGQFYAKNNPAGYITNAALTNYVTQSETGNLVDSYETGKLTGQFARLYFNNTFTGINEFNNKVIINSISGIQFNNLLGTIYDQSGELIFLSEYANGHTPKVTRAFYDNSGQIAIEFSRANRLLYDNAGNVAIDYNSRILSGGWNIPGFSGGSGGSGSIVNNYFINSGSGAYIFSTPAISGLSSQFISFPSNLGNNPFVLCSLSNLSGSDNIFAQPSGITSSGYWAQYLNPINSNAYVITTMASISTSTGLATTVIINTTNNITGNLVVSGNLITSGGAGIYNFQKTLNSGISSNIFSITNYYGNQLFDLGVTCAQSGFCVSKRYSIIAPYSGIPICNLLNNSGPYNNNDFIVSLTNTGVSGVLLNIQNIGTIPGTFFSTIFLFGSSNLAQIIQY